MGERKVQAKYYPPDFDPSKLPRIQKKRQNDDAVRFMLPMSVRCETCGEFMGTGLKFNARKSDTNENYLGIRIFRFSMRCKGCPATFSICTDPKNSDYTCESGVRRNYEPWREAKAAEEEGQEERKRQDEDAVQKLENKTIDAKQEMEDLDALDELKSANAKRANISIDDVLKRGRDFDRMQENAKEEEMLQQAKLAFERRRVEGSYPPARANQTLVQSHQPHTSRTTTVGSLPTGLKIVKKITKPSAKSAIPKLQPAPKCISLGNLNGYTSSGSSDSN